MSDLFQEASSLKVRFETSRGFLTTEDLWDLPLTSIKGPNLNDIAIGISRQLRETTESFVDGAKTGNRRLEVMLEVVKAVIAVKLAERDAAKAAKDRAEQKQKIMAIIEKKKDASLETKSVEELSDLLKSL